MTEADSSPYNKRALCSALAFALYKEGAKQGRLCLKSAISMSSSEKVMAVVGFAPCLQSSASSVVFH